MLKDKNDSENSRRMIHHIEDNHKKINSLLLIRNNEREKGMGWHLQSAETRETVCLTRNIYPTKENKKKAFKDRKLSLKIENETKALSR